MQVKRIYKMLIVLFVSGIMVSILSGCSASGDNASSSINENTNVVSSELSSSIESSDNVEPFDNTNVVAPEKEGLKDCGWIAFAMPEGWEDANESDAYETIREAANNKHVMKFMRNTLSSKTPTAADLAAKDIATETNHYTDGGKVTIGNYEWSIANFEFNGNPSAVAYTDVAPNKCLKVTIYEVAMDEPAVQEVLNSIVIDKEQL